MTRKLDFTRKVARLDGGLGSRLQRELPDRERDLAGHDGFFDALSRTRPELVERVHREFLEAGCDHLTTNTFQTAFVGEEDLELVASSVRLARGVAEDRASVLGSVGPGLLDRELDEARLARFFATLEREGCDALLFETQTDGERMVRLESLARETAPSLPRLVSVVCDVNSALPVCRVHTSEQLATWASARDVTLLSVNCATGTAPLRDALAELRRHWSGPLGAYPNAGVPEPAADGTWTYPLSPAEFAAGLAALVDEFDLKLAGGCCGTTTEHLRALHAALTGRA